MTRVDHMVPPLRPDLLDWYMELNANRGHDLLRGASDVEIGFRFTAADSAPALIKPPPLVLKPTRPSGWWPFVCVLALVVLGAAILGAVCR